MLGTTRMRSNTAGPSEFSRDIIRPVGNHKTILLETLMGKLNLLFLIIYLIMILIFHVQFKTLTDVQFLKNP